VAGRSIHRGDGGETRLGSGQRVRKDDPRLECLGGVDELSSVLGLARAALQAHAGVEAAAGMDATLLRVQRELHRLGAEVSRRDGSGKTGAHVGITADHVATLARDLADLDARLPRLHGFVLPGGGAAAAQLHVARAVCRRVERQAVHLAAAEPLGAQVVPYLNRLSLVLFSLARWAAVSLGPGDELAEDR